MVQTCYANSAHNKKCHLFWDRGSNILLQFEVIMTNTLSLSKYHQDFL